MHDEKFYVTNSECKNEKSQMNVLSHILSSRCGTCEFPFYTGHPKRA